MHCRVTWTRPRYNFGCSTLEAFKTVCVALVTAGSNPITEIESYKRLIQSVGCTPAPTLGRAVPVVPLFYLLLSRTTPTAVTLNKRPRSVYSFVDINQLFPWFSYALWQRRSPCRWMKSEDLQEKDAIGAYTWPSLYQAYGSFLFYVRHVWVPQCCKLLRAGRNGWIVD